MPRVFISRHETSLRPGQGGSINWQIGERTVVISGEDKDRIFIIESEGMSHIDAPKGTYIREGHFKDDPLKTTYALSESALWFIDPKEGS